MRNRQGKRRRVDPQGVRDRHAGAGPSAHQLERWGYTAKVPRRHAKDQDPEEVQPLAGGHLSGDQGCGPPVRMAEIHWCDETAQAADQQPRRGYAREGRPARIEVPGSPHPHEPDLDD